MEAMSSSSTKPVHAGREAFLALSAVHPMDSKLRWEPFIEQDRALLLDWVKSPEFKEQLDSTGIAVYEPETDDE
jgi:hypothetical protein